MQLQLTFLFIATIRAQDAMPMMNMTSMMGMMNMTSMMGMMQYDMISNLTAPNLTAIMMQQLSGMAIPYNVTNLTVNTQIESAYVSVNCSNLSVCAQNISICATYTQQCADWPQLTVDDYYNLTSDFVFDQLHSYEKAITAFAVRMLVKYNVSQAQLTEVLLPVGVNQAAVDRIVHTVTGDKASAIFNSIQDPNARAWASNLFYTWVNYWAPAIQDFYQVVLTDMPASDYSKSFAAEVMDFIPELLVAQNARELIYGIDYLLVLNKCIGGEYPPSYLSDKYLVPSLNALDLSRLESVNGSVVHYAVQGIVQDTLQLAYYNLDASSQAFFDSIPDEVYQELTNVVTSYSHADIWRLDAQTTIASDLVYFAANNQSINSTESVLPEEIQQTLTQLYDNWTGYADERYYNLSLPQTKDSFNLLEKDINRFIVRMFKKYNVTLRNVAALQKAGAFDFYFADVTQKLADMSPKQLYNLIEDKNARKWVKNIVKTWGRRWGPYIGELLSILNSKKGYNYNFDYNKTFGAEVLDFIPQLLFKDVVAKEDRFLEDQSELTCAKFLAFARNLNELKGVETGLIDPSLLYFSGFVPGISFQNFTSRGQLDSETMHYIIQALATETLGLIDTSRISQQSLDFLSSIPDEVYIALYNLIQSQQDTATLYDMYLKISQKEERMYIANYIESNNSSSTANTEPAYNYLFENLIYDQTCATLNMTFFNDSSMTNMTDARDLTNNYTSDTWERYEKDVANFLTLAIYRYNKSELDPFNVTHQDLINVIQNSSECAKDSYANIVQLLINNTNGSDLFNSVPADVQAWLKDYSLQFAQKWGPSMLKRLMNDTYTDYMEADDAGNYNVLYDLYDFIPLFLAKQQMTPAGFRYLKEGMLDLAQIVRGNSAFDKIYGYSANFSTWNISSPDEINSTVMAFTIKDFVFNRTGLYDAQLSNESSALLASMPEDLWLSLEDLFDYLVSTPDYYYPTPADQFIEDQMTLYGLALLDGYPLPLYEYMATYDNATSVAPDDYVEVNASYFELSNQEHYDDFSWYVKDLIGFVARAFIKYEVEDIDQVYQLFDGSSTDLWDNPDQTVQSFINDTVSGLLEDWGEAIVGLSMSGLNFTGLPADYGISQDFRTFVPLLLLSHNVTPSAWQTLLEQLDQIDQVMMGSAPPNTLGELVPRLHTALGDALVLNTPLLSYSVLAVVSENLNIKDWTSNSVDWLETFPESGALQLKDFLLSLNDTNEGNGLSIAQNIYSAMDEYYQNNTSFSDPASSPLVQYLNNNTVDFDQSYRGNINYRGNFSFSDFNDSYGSNDTQENSTNSSAEGDDASVMGDSGYWDLSNNQYYDNLHWWFKDLAKFMAVEFYKYGVEAQDLSSVQQCNMSASCDYSNITQRIMNGAPTEFYSQLPEELQTFINSFTTAQVGFWGDSIQAALTDEDFSGYDTQVNSSNILNDFQNFVPAYLLRHMVGAVSFKNLFVALKSIHHIALGHIAIDQLDQYPLFGNVSSTASLDDFNNATFVAKLVKDLVLETLWLDDSLTNESKVLINEGIPDYVYLSIKDLFETAGNTTVGDEGVDVLTSIYNELVRETLSYMDGQDLPLDKYMLTNNEDFRTDVDAERVNVDASLYNLSNDASYDSLFAYEKDFTKFMARMFVKYNQTGGDPRLNQDFNVSSWEGLDDAPVAFQESLSYYQDTWYQLWGGPIADFSANMTSFVGNPADTHIWEDLRTFLPLLLQKHNVTPEQLEELYSSLYAIADLASGEPSNSSIQAIEAKHPDLLWMDLNVTPGYLNDDLAGYLAHQALVDSFNIENLTKNSIDQLSSLDWTIFNALRDIFFALDQVIEPNGDSVIKNIYADLIIYENLTNSLNMSLPFYDAYMSDSLSYFATQTDMNNLIDQDSNSTADGELNEFNETDGVDWTNSSLQSNDSIPQDEGDIMEDQEEDSEEDSNYYQPLYQINGTDYDEANFLS